MTSLLNIGCLGTAESRTAKIIVENHSTDYVLQPSMEDVVAPENPMGESRPFQMSDGNNKWEYIAPLLPDIWFHEANVKLSWSKKKADGTAAEKLIDQSIVVRLRQDFPEAFTIFAFYSSNYTDNEVLRLESMKNSDELFESFFRAWQIADYYKRTLGVESSPFKRAAKLFFNRGVQLAESKDYLVVISSEAEQFAEEAFPKDANIIARAEEARAVYWSDMNVISKLINNKNCDGARVVVNTFKKLRDTDPKGFEIVFKNRNQSNIIENEETIIATQCPQP
jgi:hypothetical protein